MSENKRRSARQRKVNPKYANDGWDKSTLRLLRESSESSGSSPGEVSEAEELQADVEFSALKTRGGGDASSANGDDVSAASDALSKSSDVETPDEDDEERMSLASDEDGAAGSGLRRGPGKRRLPRSAPSTTVHSRGLPSSHIRNAKSSSYHSSFGPDIEDLHDALQARDTWLRGRDITVPSRETLSAVFRAFHASQEPEGAREDAPEGVCQPSFDSTMQNQILTPIDNEELHARYLLHDKPSQSVVLGPWGRQEQYSLDYLSPLDFGQAWPKSSTISHVQASLIQGRFHEGWMLNVGEKVQCVAWAPGHDEVQYLAIVARCNSTQRHLAPGEEDIRPAFHPSPPYPSAIQIWAFQTRPTEATGIQTLSMQTSPQLALVIGTDCGNIRHVKWRPSPDHGISSSHETSGLIGHLAVLSTDGHVRIISISPPTTDHTTTPPLALKVDRAGLVIPPPPNTLFTTLTFATRTDLILGAADGSIHVFDLTDPSEPSPYLTHQQHNTYVISVCVATRPSLSPFIASASAAGELVLSDLRSPDQDKVSVPRACFPSKDLVFAPFTRTFIMALDRAGNTHMDSSSATFIVAHHLRQFPTGMRVAKLPEHTGAATALAGSPHHPCILVGNAKGQIFATNYLRKILPYRKNDPRRSLGSWLHKICEYDWRPLTPSLSGGSAASAAAHDGGADIDLYHGHDTRPGVSRFHEGFKPEKIDLATAPNTKRKPSKKDKDKDKDLGAAEPIFEEEQAVTVLDWNPNRTCAGFAAMGWGSGVVRIQDLAYSAE